MRSAWLAVALGACGRFAFDPIGDAASEPGAPQLVAVETMKSRNATITLSIPPVTPGDLVVVMIAAYDTSAVVASVVDDTGANQYDATGARSTSKDAHTEIWYAANAQPGATQLTATLTKPVGGGLWFAEFSNIARANPLDKASIGNGPTTAMVTAPTVDTSAADELVISMLVVSAGGATGVTSGNPFIALPDISGDASAYVVAAQPGTWGAAWDTDGGGTVCASTAAFTPIAP